MTQLIMCVTFFCCSRALFLATSRPPTKSPGKTSLQSSLNLASLSSFLSFSSASTPVPILLRLRLLMSPTHERNRLRHSARLKTQLLLMECSNVSGTFSLEGLLMAAYTSIWFCRLLSLPCKVIAQNNPLSSCQICGHNQPEAAALADVLLSLVLETLFSKKHTFATMTGQKITWSCRWRSGLSI